MEYAIYIEYVIDSAGNSQKSIGHMTHNRRRDSVYETILTVGDMTLKRQCIHGICHRPYTWNMS